MGRLLLHICCAPDATVPFKDLKAEGWVICGYFYGSNIHPAEEYRRRLDSVGLLSRREKIDVGIRSYRPAEWMEPALPLAEEPERGRRCALCFGLQLTASAEEAVRKQCSHLGTTLTISPHKDAALISRLGKQVAASFGLIWEDRIWRKNDGFLRSLQLSEEYGLYRQKYCGCEFSIANGAVFKSAGSDDSCNL